MPKRSRKPRKPPEDEVQAAHRVLETIVGETKPLPREKNANAVALGRLGGLKGGNARAEKLSSQRLKEIASHAATVRWKKEKFADK